MKGAQKRGAGKRAALPPARRRFAIVPAREQRKIDRGVIGNTQSVEHNTARAGDFQTVAVRRRLAGVRVQLTVWPVKRHEFICEQ
jgi:hypothetical protein